jgi:predicted ATPase
LLTEGWLGYHDQALKLSQEVLALAQKLSHPYRLATASLFVTWLHALRREAQATLEMAEITINLSAEQGFPLWLASGTILRGWALAEQGQTAEGMAQIRQGLSDWRATGAEVCLSYLLALLAETYGKVGQVEDGLAVLAEALTTLEQTGERFWEAELYLLKGKLLLQAEAKAEALRQAQDEAEKCFWQAIDITRRQEARSLELRAVVSLSRLWQSQGKQVEAKQMLAEIYGWFTEGFETADLQEARTLLEELS